MTALFLLGIGLAPSTFAGWLLITAAEGRSRVLQPVERWSLGLLLGSAAVMLTAMIGSVTVNLPLTRLGFLVAHGVVLLVAGALWFLRARGAHPAPALPSHAPLPRWAAALLLALLFWTAVKIIATSGMFLFLTPTFLDDTLDNWNLRAKVYVVLQQFSLTLPRVPAEAVSTSVSSYPPLVPLLKAWLITLRGGWDEATANSVHSVWFLASLALTAGAVRRAAGFVWSIIAVYLLVSLPLYLMHGTNAYADVFLAAYLLAAVSPLLAAFLEKDADRQASYLRVGLLMAAVLPFTKNEASVLYMLPLLAALGIGLFLQWRGKRMETATLRSVLLWFLIAFVLLGLPWLVYKWSTGLTFGNAKSIGETTFSWHQGVLFSILINTFFEGNWLLLFPVFFGVLAWRWRDAFCTPLVFLTGFVLCVYGLQISIFLFTPLAYEALQQTGYARGLIHLIPIIVTLMTILLARGLAPVLSSEKQ